MDDGFHNNMIAPEELPAYEDVPLLPVSPRFAIYSVVSQGIAWSIIALGSTLALIVGEMFQGPATVAPFAALFLGAGFASLSWLDARKRAYGLREHDLIYARGIIVRRTVILPLSRVQHVETASGPLERHFNLVRLTCYTAGGLGADLVIGGLERDRAELVRQFLLSRIHGRDGEETQGDSDERR